MAAAVSVTLLSPPHRSGTNLEAFLNAATQLIPVWSCSRVRQLASAHPDTHTHTHRKFMMFSFYDELLRRQKRISHTSVEVPISMSSSSINKSQVVRTQAKVALALAFRLLTLRCMSVDVVDGGGTLGCGAVSQQGPLLGVEARGLA